MQKWESVDDDENGNVTLRVGYISKKVDETKGMKG